MRYENFTLRIRPAAAGPGSEASYEASAASPLAGESRGTLGLSEEARELLNYLRYQKSGAFWDEEDGSPHPRSMGERLFAGIFAGEVRSLYDVCRGRLGAPDLGDAGLRIQLHLDPSEAANLRFHSVPLELLSSPAEGGFLALDARRSVVRYLELPRPAEPPSFELPLKVLVVLSSPPSLASLNTQAEQTAIEQAWSIQDEVHVTVLRHATLQNLRTALRGDRFDVVHLVAHGDFDSDSGEGTLFFEAEGDQAESVGATELYHVLQESSLPSLVFLNACETARLADSSGLDPFVAIPAALLQAGIPAVVAMQLPVSDRAAITFSGAFYKSLAHGEGIDRAMYQGRLAVHLADKRSFEWAAPALFLRSISGPLFALPPIGPILVEASPGEGMPSQVTGKKLHWFQRDLYRFLGDLQIASLQDYRRLSDDERSMVSREILDRIIGLGSRPEDLLELRHVNARFPSKMLLKQPEITSSLDALHHQCALYADHATVCLPSIQIQPSYGSSPVGQVLDESSIILLLRHQELIETGKMSVVPDMVQVAGEQYRCLFDVKKLGTVTVDLSDPFVRSVFLDKGLPLRRAGALVFQSQKGKGLRLPEILEVEDTYRAEYEHFQTHLRATLSSINPEDDTRALRHALQAVDAGIQELDARYEALRKRRGAQILTALGAGTLAVVCYTTGVETISSLLASAFAGASLRSLVSFVPDVTKVPDEIRRSPFFVPWLVARKEAAL